MLPAAAALDRILEHTGYLALAATTPGGVEAGDLLHAVDRVRQVVEDGGSLADAAEALEADSEATSEVESLPLEPGRTDVVRLMNLHKAKGLEADVVFLADPCGGFTPRVDVHIERDGREALGWFKIVPRTRRRAAATLLGEHADWAAHEAGGAAVSRGGGGSPALRRRHPRPRACSSSAAGRATGKQPAWGVLNDFLAGATELPVPRCGDRRRGRAARLPSVDAQAAASGARAAAHDARARSRRGRSRR